jgi:hypothetical protein
VYTIPRIINIFRRLIFYSLLSILIIIFFLDRIIGIWLSGFFFVGYLISYLISISSKRRLLRSIRDHLIISDSEIANKLKRPVEDIRNTLFSLSKNQKKKDWLIVFLNKRYLFLNEQAVKHFELLYYKGYNEKKIFESLQQKMRIKSRAEVKAIVSTLTNQNRLSTIRQ